MKQPHRTRRDVFRLGGAALALTTLARAARAADGAPEIARGVVFHDRGGTGQRQPEDPGIPGVLVSNGRRVTRTDSRCQGEREPRSRVASQEYP